MDSIDVLMWFGLGVLLLSPLIYLAHKSDQKNRELAIQKEQEQERLYKEAASLSATNNRNIIASFVQRGDYIHLSDQDFSLWLDLNKGHLFAHEIEAMVRHRAAQKSTKSHPRE